MRKILAVITLAATLLSLLCGCGSEKEAPTTAPLSSGLTSEDFLGNLEEMLEPIAEQYEMTLGRKHNLESGSICQLVTIEEKILEGTYELLVYSTLAGDVDMIILNAEKGERTNLDFALLSCYIYGSTELPKMDADAFYDEFKLLSPEPDGFLQTDGWLVGARFTETRLTFSVSYRPDLS